MKKVKLVILTKGLNTSIHWWGTEEQWKDLDEETYINTKDEHVTLLESDVGEYIQTYNNMLYYDWTPNQDEEKYKEYRQLSNKCVTKLKELEKNSKRNKRTESNKAWQEKNRDKARYLRNRSTARNFIKKQAAVEDIEELKQLIKEREQTIKVWKSINKQIERGNKNERNNI